jgi:Fur family peroxide stress response transcriptional regulator
MIIYKLLRAGIIMELSMEKLSEALSKRGIRPSYQRVKVLEYLLARKCHPTVDQIYSDLHKEIPTISKSTVYNTLNSLAKANLTRAVLIEDKETRYDFNVRDHGHFKCESCGGVFDFTVNIDDFVTDELNHFQTREKNVYFKGICPACLKGISAVHQSGK